MTQRPLRRRKREPLLCVSGRFKSVACFNPKTLHLKHEIPTPKENNRVISIPAEDGREEDLVVVGEKGSLASEVLLHSPHEKIDSPFRKLSISHSSGVQGLCYVTPRLVVSGSDHRLVVSDVNSGERMDLKDPPQGVGRITAATAPSAQHHDGGAPRRGDSFVFVGGGDVALSDDDDNSIRHYDLGRSERVNEVVQKFKGHAWWAQGLGYSTEKNLLFSSSPDKTLRIWSVQDGTCLETLQLFYWSDSLLYDPKKQLIFCGGFGGIIEVWDYRHTKKRVGKFNHPTEGYRGLRIRDLAQIGDGEYASIGEQDYSVATWTDSGKILAKAKTCGNNYGLCYVGGSSADALRSDDADRLAFLLRMCYAAPTESVRVAGCLVGKSPLCQDFL